MRLHERQVSLAVFSRLPRSSATSSPATILPAAHWQFLSEIALDRKNVGHIAVVIVGPDVLIGVGVDQLHVDTHLVSRAAHAALENIGHTERLADFT